MLQTTTTTTITTSTTSTTLDRARAVKMALPPGPASTPGPAYCISPAAVSPQGLDPLAQCSRRRRQLKGVADLQCPTRHTGSANQPLSVQQHQSSSRSSLLPMSQPPLESSVRVLLSAKVPQGVTVEHIRAVPSPRLKRIYEVKLSNSRTMVLVLAPPAMLRLLRSEQLLIRSEAEVIRWLRDKLSKHDPKQRMATGSSGGQETCISSSTEDGEQQNVGAADLTKDLDPRCLPSLIAHSSTTKEIGSAFNLLSHISGCPVSSLATPLTTLERRQLNFQIGRLVRQFARIESPSGRFGPALAVLTPPSSPPRHAASGGIITSGGAGNWSVAFQAMLESILRDAEDMAVTVAYAAIRRNFRRLGYLLDDVTTPRLVILDSAEDSNIMVDRQEPKGNTRKPSPKEEDSDDDDGDENEEEEQSKPSQASDDGTASEKGEATGDGSGIFITGLRDWSHCLFGDPLMATVFYEQPTEDFLRGFNGREERSSTPPSYDEEIVEDKDSVYIRLLLYQCYHATVSIVQEFYRPRSDSRDRELAARRKLHEALSKLEDIDENSKRRHRRPSGEVSPAKKPKADDED